MEKIKVKSKVNKDADFDIFMDGIKMTGDVVRSLIAIRKAKGLTQSDIANRCGIKQSAVARFEARVIIPRFDTVAKYAKAVGEKIAIAEEEAALTKEADPEPFLFINPGAYWSHRMGCYARIRRSDIGPKYGVYKKYRRYAIKKARHYKGDLQGNDYRKLYDIIWLLW